MAEKLEVITIDGPSGAGKSTISRQLAARLGYTYLDTGAMYRAVGLAVKRADIDPDSEVDRPALDRLLADIDISLAAGEQLTDEMRVFLNGEEVSRLVRTAEMGLVASRVSAEPRVRRRLTELQQQLGRRGRVVAEGRDTGTVVFPGARHKFYLDAAPEVRARRRCRQLAENGQEAPFEEILAQIIKRDRDDAGRALAPLRAAPDARIVDTSNLTIEQVVSRMLECIHGTGQ